MNDKMREALELAREAIESHYPSHSEYKVAAALIALAEQPAKGEAVAWPPTDEAGLPLYAILAAWADLEQRNGGQQKEKALRAASRALDPTWKSCGRPECAAAPAPAVPEGYRLLPAKLPNEMAIAAGDLASRRWCYCLTMANMRELWDAMLAAAPEVPAAPDPQKLLSLLPGPCSIANRCDEWENGRASGWMAYHQEMLFRLADETDGADSETGICVEQIEEIIGRPSAGRRRNRKTND